MIKFILRISFLLVLMLGAHHLSAQSNLLEGKVSFLTSSNTYVRFVSTEQIEVGDTLTVKLGEEYKACLIVEQKSSTSCVCRKIEACTLTKGATVFYRKRQNTLSQLEADLPTTVNVLESELFDTDSLQSQVLEPAITEEVESLQSVNARISASSYSSLDDNNNRHRMMMRMSLGVDKIDDSNFSFDSYVNYRRNFEQFESSSFPTSMLRVYRMALRYQNDSTGLLMTLGRNINSKMSSVGAIDGLQAQKRFNNLYVGGIIGFRPDIFEFDFNPNLLEYGVFVGTEFAPKRGFGQITFGVLEQKNGSAIDRRYSYFQFSGTFNRNLSLFASGEADLFSSDGTVKSYSPQLTNLLLSIRYRFDRRISLSVSYDSRKRIIYYETLRTDLERLLADDEARQGIRTRLNLRPLKFIIVGLSFSKRFQNSNQNKSDNYNAFIGLTKVPGLNGRLNFSYNLNKSNFQNTTVMTARHSRTLVKRKLNADFYFRHVSYDYFNTETRFSQYYIGTGMSWNIRRDLAFNFLVEYSKNESAERYRINTKLVKRFRSK